MQVAGVKDAQRFRQPEANPFGSDGEGAKAAELQRKPPPRGRGRLRFGIRERLGHASFLSSSASRSWTYQTQMARQPKHQERTKPRPASPPKTIVKATGNTILSAATVPPARRVQRRGTPEGRGAPTRGTGDRKTNSTSPT